MEIAQKLELRLAKRAPLRFISHHDLMRALERAARRAALPVRRTEGFNPGPRIVLVQALPVGVCSEDEVAEIELYEWVRPAEFETRLRDALPDGLEVIATRLLRPVRKGQALAGAEYSVRLPEGLEISRADIEALMAREEAFVERPRPNETKRVNVRRYIEELSLSQGKLHMRLRTENGGLARPEEVVAVLAGVDPTEMKGLDVVKTRTVLAAQPTGR